MKFPRLTLRFLLPMSTHEDVARHEFILNVFTFSIVVLLAVAVISSGITHFFIADEIRRENNALSFVFLFGLLLFYGMLLMLSRRGFVRVASYTLLGTLLAFALYLASAWGVDLPAAILLDVLTIVMAGILIGTRFAFLTTAVVIVSIATINLLQQAHVLSVNRFWATQGWELTDVAVAGVILVIIATVSWLSNREIEQSLARARKSERELKEERDTLEVRIEERTKELRAAESEKMAQTYRFVEFGRIAGGLFHDLVNPLAAISLNIQSIANSQKDGKAEALVEDVERARMATEHMRNLMESMRKHISHSVHLERFSVRAVIFDVTRVLEGYARARRVQLHADISDDVTLLGNPTQFTQVLTNLISNAVESFSEENTVRTVRVSVTRQDGTVEIAVRDTGSGIAKEDIQRIFEPFFSTKKGEGLGIGLSLTKRIVEKEFKGSLIVTSEPGVGSEFVIRLPV